MRFAALLLALVSACNSQLAAPTDSPPTSLHDQLAEAPTRLLMMPTSRGSIVAQRWSSDGWQQGLVELTITDGEIIANLDDAGQLVVTKMAIGFAPIEIPSTVIGTSTELTDVRLTLESAAPVAPAWADDDDAHVSTTVDMGLSWSLHTGTSTTPLGTQDLHGLPLDMGLNGNGLAASGTLEMDAMGDVWTWAGLVKLSDLSLALDAATVSL